MWMFVTKQWPEDLFENYLANTTAEVYISLVSTYLMKQKHQTLNQKLFENRLIDVGNKENNLLNANNIPNTIFVPIVPALKIKVS